MGQYGIGQSVKRFEDPRLVRGEGRFHNDVNLPGQAHVVVVRSLHAHGRILSIETAAAAGAQPGPPMVARLAAPGSYQVTLSVNGREYARSVTVLEDVWMNER